MNTTPSPQTASEETAFSQLPLSVAMVQNLTALGYHHMTPIQAQALPHLLKGQDLIAQAQTGSGKTAAFGITILHHLTPRDTNVQSLVLCPTRELAEQITQELRQLAKAISNIKILTLGGGVAIRPQAESLEHGAHIVVGTAGRIQKHLDNGTLRLEHLKTLVLDEADRMLDMGFYDSISAIIKQAPAHRQTLLFSATYPEGIERLSRQLMNNALRIQVNSAAQSLDIEQRCYEIEPAQRLDAVVRVLHHVKPISCIAFCNTKQQCQTVSTHLQQHGISAKMLNGDLDQRDRDEVVAMFANHSISVLVATDVAARGLNIAGLDLVINVELAHEPETHLHRIGRTGRAGATGIAVSLVAGAEARRASAIETHGQHTLLWYPLAELSQEKGMLPPKMMTLAINAGRREKLRAGDIVGALTSEQGLAAQKIGKIAVHDQQSFVAVERSAAKQALKRLTSGKIKGKAVRVRLLSG